MRLWATCEVVTRDLATSRSADSSFVLANLTEAVCMTSSVVSDCVPLVIYATLAGKVADPTVIIGLGNVLCDPCKILVSSHNHICCICTVLLVKHVGHGGRTASWDSEAGSEIKPSEHGQQVPFMTYVLLLGQLVRVVCIRTRVKDRKVYNHRIRRFVIIMIL